MRYINIKNLKNGMIIAEDILSEKGSIPLVKKNSILTDNIIESLNSCNIKGVYIDDSLSKNIEIKSNIPESLQSKTISSLKNMNIEGVIESAKEIVDSYMYLSDISFDKINKNTSTYEHALNVCEFSVAVGKMLDYNRDNLIALATASLLHDIGKICVDNKLFDKLNVSDFLSNRINIDKESKNYHYYMHPAYGHNILSNIEIVSSNVKAAVLEHHENEDGTGFPLGLKGKEINEYAKVIHVCETYDNLLSSYSPSEALEFLMGGSGTKFDYEIVKVFSKNIPIYPKGVTVLLSNGLKAIVYENNKENPLRPKLLLEFNGQVYDLMMPILKNVTITKVEGFESSIDINKSK